MSDATGATGATLPPIVPKRIVKPRKTGGTYLPIISVTRDKALIERTGETYPISELPSIIVAEPSSIIVAENIGRHIIRLNKVYDEHPRWQFKCVPSYTRGILANGERTRAVAVHTVFAFFGFSPTPGSHARGHYHYPLDPTLFVRSAIGEIDERSLPNLVKLLEWAQQVRGFCLENRLTVRPTSGGLAGQLLRDKRFYPEDRRKVPKLINAAARDQMPGNYYRLFAKERTAYNAVYLDMKSAHHHCASIVKFPCANHLHAYGHSTTLEDKPWAWPGTRRFDKALAQHGLFYVKLRVPAMPRGTFPLPCLEKKGNHLRYVYSNELDDIRASGAEIAYIVAAWVSSDVDTGLGKYARWAIEQNRIHADKKKWLKPTLLSTYGVLAAAPQHLEMGFARMKDGTEKFYPVGNEMMRVEAVRTSKPNEMNSANVIHRGMIEAQTRLESLYLARHLHKAGVTVLAIYADSVIVEDKQLPFLPHPWIVESYLTGLHFLSATQFISQEVTKLPGLPREGERWALTRRSVFPEFFRPTSPIESAG